jgi:hypothetical protein
MTDPTPADVVTTDASTATTEPEAPQVDATEPDTFSREYVSKLRAEAAEARVRAKIADVANEHLLTAYAAADGRLVDADALPLSPDLLGDDGLVDRDRVADAIAGLLTAKPYLQARRPVSSLPMGVRSDPPAEVGWVDVLRGAR